MRLLRLLALASLAWALPQMSSPAGAAPAPPGALAAAPVHWDSFAACVQYLERWVGPNLPDWVVHSKVYGYTSRRPLYDGLGRPLRDDRGRQRSDPVHLSGRVFYPPAWRGIRRLPLVVYSHATTLQKDAVASEFGGHEWIFAAAAAAYYGFAVAMPDLPGMGGDGTSYHPFCHARSLAWAVVDGIPALQAAFAQDPYLVWNGYAWDGKVYLTGYSEGGYASLAAARELETHREDFGGAGFILGGAACMAGPFDISGLTRKLIVDPVKPFRHAFFIPYVVVGYHGIYGRIMDPMTVLSAEMLRTGEDGNILQWVNGTEDGLKVDRLIARRLGVPVDRIVVRNLLNSVWVASELDDAVFSRNPDNPIYRILTENDLANGWAPTRPLLFVQSTDDRDVPVENTLQTMASLSAAIKAEGRDPAGILRFRSLGTGVSHLEGVFLAIPLAFDWIYHLVHPEAAASSF